MEAKEIIEKISKYRESQRLEEDWHQVRKDPNFGNYLITDSNQRIAFTDGQGDFKFDKPDLQFKPTTLGDEWHYLNLQEMQNELSAGMQGRFYSDTQYIRDALEQSEPGVRVNQISYAKGEIVNANIKALGIKNQLKEITGDLIELAQQGIAVEESIVPAEVFIEMGILAVDIENNPSFSEDTSKDLREALKEQYPSVFGISLNRAFNLVYETYSDEIADDIKGYRNYSDSSIAENEPEKFSELLEEVRKTAKEFSISNELAVVDVVSEYILENYPDDSYSFDSLSDSSGFKDMLKAVSALTLKEADEIESDLIDIIKEDSDIQMLAHDKYVKEYAMDILAGSTLIEFRLTSLGNSFSAEGAYYPEHISEWDENHFESLAEMMKLVNADGKDLYRYLVDNDLIEQNGEIESVLNFEAKEGKKTSVETIMDGIDNSYGGNAILFGFMPADEYVNLDFSKPIEISGNIYCGIYDAFNGSGYLSESGIDKITLPANYLNQDNVIEGSFGYDVDETFGYHRPSVEISAQNIELQVEKKVKKGIEI